MDNKKQTKVILVIITLAIITQQPANAQSYTDSSGNPRVNFTEFQSLGDTSSSDASELFSSSWYAEQITAANLTATWGGGSLGVTSWSTISNLKWMLNLIAPIQDNVTTIMSLLKTWPPQDCRPDLLRTIIGRLSSSDLEALVNTSISGSPGISNANNYPPSCLKMFSMIYMLRRDPTTMTTRDIDLMLPAGLYLVPPYLLRNMPGPTLNYMLTQICKQAGTVLSNPGSEVPTLHLRALIDQAVMNVYAVPTPLPSGRDLCRCLPYIRRPVIEEFNTFQFSQVYTQNCYINESSTLDFTGQFRDPAYSPTQQEFRQAVFYPQEKCRYGRAPMADWTTLSKTYHKVNMTYYNVLNCMSLDKRQNFRSSNVSVAWDMLNEVMHRPMSINDREDTCYDFRGGYNQGVTFLNEQSLQQLGDGVSCLANFEIRRIPNLYLCLTGNLQRFADPLRFIQPEVKWEVARKCDDYFFRDETIMVVGPPAPGTTIPTYTYKPIRVADKWGDLVQYLPLMKLQQAAQKNSLEAYWNYLEPYIGLMPQAHRYVIAAGITRPFNNSFYYTSVRPHCKFRNVHVMSTVTFINNASTTCTNYYSLSLPQKIVAAKRIINANASVLQTAIDGGNLTMSLLLQYQLNEMLDALPYDVYTAFQPDEVIDDAVLIVNRFPRIDTNRLKLLSEAVIREFKRRAIAKYGDPKDYPHEMVEPLLDGLPCQLLMHLRPYDISNIQDDLVTCRTLSRRWASCPQFLLKTQAYREYACNVFFHCGNVQEPDYDHLIDDLGTYCFCNLTDGVIANITKDQIIRMFPVLSELPNCLSQFARITITSRIIDIYPPKSYVTSLTLSGQEAWLTEIGKLACNLNAAVISERYKTNTFGSQAEYLGRVCCFNWTTSGTPLQRRIMTSVYFNKSADDIYDIRKMCERMFNTTAYIIDATKADAANSRKKRDVDDANTVTTKRPARTVNNTRTRGCNPDDDEGMCPIPDELEEEAEDENVTSAVVTLSRHKRDIIVDEAFSWTCPLLKALTRDSLYLLSADDMNDMKHLDFVRCLQFFGGNPNLGKNFSLAVIARIRVELSRYFSFCDTAPRILIQLGYMATYLTPANISCLNLTDEVVVAFGEIEKFSEIQLQAIANRYINITKSRNDTFGIANMVLMRHILCGLDLYYLSAPFLSDSDFEGLVPIFAGMKSCPYAKLQFLFTRATALFGPVTSWQEEHFVELGIIAAGMSSADAATLTGLQLRWLRENVVTQLDFVSKLTAGQLQNLLPEQVRYIMPYAYLGSVLPLNKTLGSEKVQALIAAELDDMYLEPLRNLYAKATNIRPTFSVTFISLILALFAMISLDH